MSVTQEAHKTLVASIHTVELAREHFSRVMGLRNGAVFFDVSNSDVTDAMLSELYDLRGLRGEL